jgi:predicted nucleotidyltransferase
MRAAWLFGSVARGDAGSSSDVDLLVVVDDLESPELRNGLALLADDVLDWTGNALQVVEHTPASWRRLVRSGKGLVDEVRRDGIALAGDPKPLLAKTR